MNLSSRLKNLEQTERALSGDSGERSREILCAKFETMTSRLEGVAPDEKWLKRASRAEIAAMGMLENSNGSSTQLLWAKIKDLSVLGSESSQRLFTLLGEAHGTN